MSSGKWGCSTADGYPVLIAAGQGIGGDTSQVSWTISNGCGSRDGTEAATRSRLGRRRMRQRWLVGWFGVGLVALLTACGSGATGGMNSNDWATVGAYEQSV